MRGEHQKWGRKYFKTLNVAFFNTYLRDKPPAIGYADSPLQSDVGALQRTQANRSEYLPYLSAAAARTMSMNKPMQLDFIGALSPQDLKKPMVKNLQFRSFLLL